MIYSSIGPNPRFFAAMTNALASSGNSKNAHKSTVRRMVISTGAPSVGAVSRGLAPPGRVRGPRAAREGSGALGRRVLAGSYLLGTPDTRCRAGGRQTVNGTTAH